MWDVDGFDEEDAEMPRLTSHSSEEWSADDEDDEAAEDTWPPPKPSKVHIEAALRAPRTVEEITAIVTHVGLGLETGAFSSSKTPLRTTRARPRRTTAPRRTHAPASCRCCQPLLVKKSTGP